MQSDTEKKLMRLVNKGVRLVIPCTVGEDVLFGTLTHNFCEGDVNAFRVKAGDSRVVVLNIDVIEVNDDCHIFPKGYTPIG